MKKAVIRKKNGKLKIASTEVWLEFLAGLAKDIEAGTIHRYAEDDSQPQARRNGNACRECCGRGGVEFCGMYVAICRDGSTCVLG